MNWQELVKNPYRVGVDCDDVVLKSIDAYVSFVNERFNLCLSREEFRLYYRHPLLEDFETLREFYHSERFSTLPLVEGAEEGLRFLKEEGFELYLVTGRPKWVEPKTLGNVESLLPGVFSDVYHAEFSCEAKARYCREKNIAWFVDDFVGNLSSLEEDVLKVLFDPGYPWNEGAEGFLKASSWNDLTSHFKGYKEVLRKADLFKLVFS